ncbi:MAG: hypothetical protein QW738_03455 [Nitrososphaeria archaeon]
MLKEINILGLLFFQKVWSVADPIKEYFIESILENRDTSSFVKHQVHFPMV